MLTVSEFWLPGNGIIKYIRSNSGITNSNHPDKNTKTDFIIFFQAAKLINQRLAGGWRKTFANSKS